MGYLSYREDQLRAALGRFSPARQLLFGLSLCERLLALHAITTGPEKLRVALDAVWEQLESGQTAGNEPALAALMTDIEAMQQVTTDVIHASQSIAQECRHAVLTLLETSGDSHNRLEDILIILRISREAVELLAFENLRLVSWDKWADEKTRIHPLVQGELNAIFSDLRQIWELPDDPAGYTAFRNRLEH